MQNIPQDQIDKRFQTLPEILQDTIFSEKTADIIGKTCTLREADAHTPTIAKLTGRVLLGFLRPELFAQEVQGETGVSPQQAQDIAHDIDAEIFSNVRLELKKLYPPTIKTPTVQTHGFTPRTATEIKIPPKQPTGAFAFAHKFAEKSEAPAFAKASAGKPLDTARDKPLDTARDKPFDEAQGKAKYVIPIPDKFRQKPKFETQSSKLKVQNHSEKPKSGTQNQESRIKNQETARGKPLDTAHSKLTDSVQTEITAVNVEARAKMVREAAKDAEIVQAAREKFKPIVPLPTFIQSKFKGMRVQESRIKNPAAAEAMAGKQELGEQNQEPRAKNQETDIQNHESRIKNQEMRPPAGQQTPNKTMFSKFTKSSTALPKPKPESPYREPVPPQPNQEKQGKVIDLSRF